MSQRLIGKGPGIVAEEVNLGGKMGPTLAVQISQAAGENISWLLTVIARTDQGEWTLGTARTRPTIPDVIRGVPGDPPSRVVLLANCPGVTQWQIVVEGPEGAVADLDLSSNDCCGLGSPALIPVNGTRILGRRTWPQPLLPNLLALQGVIADGAAILHAGYGNADPAGAACFFGFVDKSFSASGPIVNGDLWRVQPVPIPAASAAVFSFFFGGSYPDEGVDFLRGIQWCLSTTDAVVTVVPAPANAARFQAEVT